MAFWNNTSEWLVKQLIERCKEGTFVDNEDLDIILSLNIVDYHPSTAYQRFGFGYGKLIQALGKVVAAKGELIVHNPEDYTRTEVLKPPAEWLQQWSDDETVPKDRELGAVFDVLTGLGPDGHPLTIDGPGALSAENWERHCNERDRIMERRRLRRLAADK